MQLNFNILRVKLQNAYSRPQNRGVWGLYPQNGEQYERDPQKAHPWAETRRMTYRSSKSVNFKSLIGPLLRARREPRNKAKKLKN